MNHGTEARLAAERNVLGSLLLHRDAVADVAFLRSEDFYLVRHQIIYSAILEAHATINATDPLVVANVLRSRDRLDEIGGHNQLLDLMESVVTAVGVENHAQIILAHAMHRAADNVGREMALRMREGHDVAEVVVSARQQLDAIAARVAAKPGATRQAQVLSIDDLHALPRLTWQIMGMVPAASVGFLVGPPNCGKSVIALDWTMRAVTASDWHGRRVRAGSALYILGEGAAGFGQRIAAWHAHHPAARRLHHVSIIRRLPALSAFAGLRELREVVAEHAQAHGKPVIVVIDTLALHWAESEDRSEFVGPAMSALADIATEFGCSIVLVHHERKPQQQGNGGSGGGGAWASLRGSGAWAGAADFVLQVRETTTEGGIELTTTKQRDAGRAPPVALQVYPVDVPGVVDEEGRPVRSPVLVPAADAQSTVHEPQQAASLEARVYHAVETLARMGGSTSSKNALAEEMGGKTSLARSAIAVAVDRGLIHLKGPKNDRTYCLPGANGGSPPCGYTPQTPSQGPGPFGGPGLEGPCGGPVAGPSGPVGPVNREDDGLPEQPGGRRRHGGAR